MNFGETLAYWYLRLNGFFPLTNFVLHDVDIDATRHRTYSADCDLLAIRFPHVYEDIGGTKDDWDDKFDEWNLALNITAIGLIVEVKTGDIGNLPEGSFAEHRIKYGVQRLGFWEQNKAEIIAQELTAKSIYCGEGFTIAKLLIASKPPRSLNSGYLTLSLEHINHFLVSRMEKYSEPKLRARMFFPDDLVQYIIWKSSQKPSEVKRPTNELSRRKSRDIRPDTE